MGVEIMNDRDELLDRLRAGRVCSRPRKVNGQYTRCWSNDAATCRACSELNSMYMKKVIAGGLQSTDSQFFLLTLTAPSFGKTHSVPHDESAELRVCGCGMVHEFEDALTGVPLDLSRYGYRDAVEWNHYSSQLFAVSMKRLSRSLSGVEWIAIREFQMRGSLHLHVVVRTPKALDSTVVYEELKKLSSTRSGKFGWGRRADVRAIQRDSHEATVRYLAKAVTYTVKALGKSEDGLSDEQRDFFSRLDAASVRLKYSNRAVRGFGYGGNTFSKSSDWSDDSKASLKEEARIFAALKNENSDERNETLSAVSALNGESVREYAKQMNNSEDYNPDSSMPEKLREMLAVAQTRYLPASWLEDDSDAVSDEVLEEAKAELENTDFSTL